MDQPILIERAPDGRLVLAAEIRSALELPWGGLLVARAIAAVLKFYSVGDCLMHRMGPSL